MALTKMLLPVGNSVGIVIDKPILRMLGWDENTWVVMWIANDTQVKVRRATADEVDEAMSESPQVRDVDGGRPESPDLTTPANPKANDAT